MGSTLGACGDLNRNVLAPAAPYAKRDYLFAQETADNIAALLSPQSGFYYDMWVDGEQFMTAEAPEVVEARNDNSHGTNFVDSPEPIYGTQFLPRKFKIAVTVPTDNSVDLLTNDIGVVVVSDENGEPQGFNIYVSLCICFSISNRHVYINRELKNQIESKTEPKFTNNQTVPIFLEPKNQN